MLQEGVSLLSWGQNGISIAINNEYASKNNHSSIYCVRNRLANTYSCSSDDCFTENPFEPYVWHAYYAAQWSVSVLECTMDEIHDVCQFKQGLTVFPATSAQMMANMITEIPVLVSSLY